MESSPEASVRFRELEREAPIVRRGAWRRIGNRVYLCGAIGPAFDTWQRRLSAVSAADGYFAQRIGLEAVERVMDDLEAEARGKIAAGERLSPRWSPGYGDKPLEMSREILDALDASRKLGVSLTDAFLLVPTKSVTAVCDIF